MKKKLAMKRKKKRKGKDAAMDEPRTLQAPIYRLARERIESTVAYSEVRYVADIFLDRFYPEAWYSHP